MKPKSYCKHLVVIVLLVRYSNSWRVYIWQLGRLCSTCVPELLLVFVSDTLQFIGAHCPSWWVGQNWKVVWCAYCGCMPTITCGEIWRASFTCKASARGAFYLCRHNRVTHAYYSVPFKKFLAPWGAVTIWINRDRNLYMTSHCVYSVLFC